MYQKKKKLSKFINNKTNNPIKKSAKSINTNEDAQVVNRHMKRCPVSYDIRGMQIKTTVRYHSIPVRMAESWSPDSTKCCQRCGAGRIEKWCSHTGGQLAWKFIYIYIYIYT